jgi:hypothetical protein
MYALRLPDAERASAIAAGAKRVWEYPAYPGLGVKANTFDLATIGPEWVFGNWARQEPEWIAAAYDNSAD